MGRYASYGIIDSFRISLSSLNSRIRDKVWGKSLKDYEMSEIISQFPTDVYDVEISEDRLSFNLKDSITSKDIVSVMEDFFKIFPERIEGKDILFKKLSSMTMNELRTLASQKEEMYFQNFRLYGIWYGMRVEVGNHIFYPETDVEGFLIYLSDSKMAVEDDISPFDFLTELIRYRLKENRLSNTLLSFLSQ